MKRAITFTLTLVVAIGMIAMLGFVGGVAAQADGGDGGAGGDGGNATAETSVEQSNTNAQTGNAASLKGDSTVVNSQDSAQGNYADTTTVANAEGGDGGNGGDGGDDSDGLGGDELSDIIDSILDGLLGDDDGVVE